jgi:hypothetical protein
MLIFPLPRLKRRSFAVSICRRRHQRFPCRSFPIASGRLIRGRTPILHQLSKLENNPCSEGGAGGGETGRQSGCPGTEYNLDKNIDFPSGPLAATHLINNVDFFHIRPLPVRAGR